MYLCDWICYWNAVSVASNRRPWGWRRLFSHLPGWLQRAGDFVQYDAQSCEVFVTELGLNREARPSTQLSSSTRLKSTKSARLPDNEFEVFFTALASNMFARILACRCLVEYENNVDHFVEVHHITRLSAVELSFPLLLTGKPTSLSNVALRMAEVEKTDVDEPSAKRVFFVQYYISDSIDVAIDFYQRWLVDYSQLCRTCGHRRSVCGDRKEDVGLPASKVRRFTYWVILIHIV